MFNHEEVVDSMVDVALSLNDAERQLEQAERVAQALREVVDALSKLARLNGHVAEVLATDVASRDGEGQSYEESRPRGREAVRLIVATRPGLWTLSQIVREMQQRGWYTSRKGAEVAVARLIANGEAARTSKKGAYLFPAPQVEEVAA